jgi:pimeloyl-ACP methyl ester carboxylesterase
MVVLLAHEEHGSGEPWFFLHGFPFHRGLWSPLLDLQTEGRLILPDLRGHGESPPGPRGPATMEAMAEDVMALADRLGIRGFGLVGHSMGGYVALALQAMAPERVRALVLLDTQAGADTPEAAAKREVLARKVEGEGVGVLLREFVPKLLSPASREEPALLRRVEEIVLANEPAGLAAALRGMALRQDHRPRLARIACPALVAVGELDEVTPPAKARELAEGIPDARLIELPGSGHLPSLEAPDLLTEALRGFMRETPLAASASKGA